MSAISNDEAERRYGKMGYSGPERRKSRQKLAGAAAPQPLPPHAMPAATEPAVDARPEPDDDSAAPPIPATDS